MHVRTHRRRTRTRMHAGCITRAHTHTNRIKMLAAHNSVSTTHSVLATQKGMGRNFARTLTRPGPVAWRILGTIFIHFGSDV